MARRPPLRSVAVSACIAFIALFATAHAYQDTNGNKCPNYIKVLSAGLRLYAQDYDEQLPIFTNTPKFQSDLLPFIPSSAYFYCLVTRKEYRVNTTLSGKALAEFDSLATTETFRDSQPHPDGGISISYLDGHVTYNGKSPDDPNSQCLANAQMAATALAMYSQDYDERLPPMTDAQSTFKNLWPYARNAAVFLCPATNTPYRLNAALSGVSLSTLGPPATVMVLGDSKPHKDQRFTVAFLDGHAVHDRDTAPPFGSHKQDVNTLCRRRASQVNLGILMYAQDHDETFPPMHTIDELQNSLKDYVTDSSLFICPATNLPYQPNAALSGVSEASIADPTHTETFRDQQPHPDGKYTVGYADGHVTH
jgi:prepilin-type processing-associated H-X9-DG protein